MFRPPPTQLAPPGSPDRTVQDRARTMPLWQESSIACAGYVFHFFPYEAKLYFQDFVPDVPGFLDLCGTRSVESVEVADSLSGAVAGQSDRAICV